jgi:hypothetical protein
MPYQLIRLKGNKYRVINKLTGKIHSSETTKDKAEAQIRLLEMFENMKK